MQNRILPDFVELTELIDGHVVFLGDTKETIPALNHIGFGLTRRFRLFVSRYGFLL